MKAKKINSSKPITIDEQFENIKFSLLRGINHKSHLSTPITSKIITNTKKR